MQTLMLYGQLGKEFGRVHRYEVKSPAEAVKALCATIKGFKSHVLDNRYYRVIVGGKEDVAHEDAIHNPVSEKETIRIVPVVSGSSGFGRVLAGAALIGLSLAFPAASATLSFGSFSSSFSLATLALNAGTSLVLSGVAQMLFTPQQSRQEMSERPENRPSFFFNGAVNTTRQGNAVPVCYGRMVVGSQVISSGLSVEQI